MATLSKQQKRTQARKTQEAEKAKRKAERLAKQKAMDDPKKGLKAKAKPGAAKRRKK